MYLNVRTEADTLKSTIRIERLAAFLKQNKITSCAVANTNLYRLMDYISIFKKNDLKPVVALRVNVAFGINNQLPILLYAKNNEGYSNLIKVSSGIMERKDEIMPLNWVKPYSKGLIVVIPFIENHWLNSMNEIKLMKEIFNEDCYIGISRTNNFKHTEEINIQEIANSQAIQIVALNESFYLQIEDAFAYEVLTAIDTGKKLDALDPQDTSKYVPLPQELEQWFVDKPDWIKTAKSVLDACNIDFGEYQAHMPVYPLNNGETPKECLHRLAYEGLKIRNNGQIPTVYKERLNYELEIISKMGYDSYFLIVADFMAFSKREGILTGPGRGSSASSLVAYSLQITQVDPIKYQLLFERFLNPYRISLPDIDIDFIDTRRTEVIQYVKNKYGKDHVAQIVAFGTLTAKAVARDVGRMLNFQETELKLMSKLIEKSKTSNIMDVYKSSKEFQEFVNKDRRNQVWYDTCCRLEGLTRNKTTHAAGVVLTPKPLINYVPLQSGNDGIYLTQWDMNEVEGEGVLKMDFLGLANLRIIDNVLISLQNTYKVKPTLETIPLDNQNTFNLLQRGWTEGIFQLESEGMRDALKQISPTKFEDIIAINALYRPGPMEFISTYAKRKHGLEKITYLHPLLEPILKETYGIIIYQEQILRIAQVYAGFTVGEADLLRRAIGKKKREILEEQQALFVQGAINQNHDVKVAEEIYSLIVKFAEYGFPKSHATAYSVITYQMAFLKANYPSHFYAALLNQAIGNVPKVKRILAEMSSGRISILPLDILESDVVSVSTNKAVRLGLLNIKGLSEQKLQTYTKGRGSDLFEYARNIGSAFDKMAMEVLIKAGAFDNVFNQTRGTLLASLDRAADYSLTDESLDFGFGTPTYELMNANKDNCYQLEIESCGFSLSNHPIESSRTIELKENTISGVTGQFVKVPGLIEAVKITTTKKNEEMAFVTISDEHGSSNVKVFPILYNKIRQLLVEGNLIILEGKIEQKYGKKSITANKIAMFQ
ncbi:DNA polymerase III subunit alpha [Lysinibacillus sp. UGB7]|uniref:DNA polymerase III subunit alpha n=1 Tax=Lysinibacillus sp. UGB7 TaxID=3411039 RepID=UPI003B7B149F